MKRHYVVNLSTNFVLGEEQINKIKNIGDREVLNPIIAHEVGAGNFRLNQVSYDDVDDTIYQLRAAIEDNCKNSYEVWCRKNPNLKPKPEVLDQMILWYAATLDADQFAQVYHGKDLVELIVNGLKPKNIEEIVDYVKSMEADERSEYITDLIAYYTDQLE